MPTLNWIGKEAVVNHDKEVSFRLLKKIKSASVGNAQNLVIHGDNLEALKALMPFYTGKVKCIYIDPPYNTGNEGWIYNDKVNSPKIKKWLGKVVGRDSEDLCRHDKWLCIMYPRLKLLRDLLSDDGSIFVSIDDNEHCNLKQVLDEIFREENFVANIIWQKKYTQSNDAKYFSTTHDFIVCYAKDKKNTDFNINLIARTEEQDARYKNPDNDPRGPWMTQPLHAKSGTDTGYEFTFENGVKWRPPAGTFPRYSVQTLKGADKEGTIWFGKKGDAVPRLKKYLNEMKQGVIPKTIWLYDEVGSNDDARREFKELAPENGFDSPKPTSLINRIIGLASDKNSTILDFFAGSGTTGHAVLKANKFDNGTRNFILCTNNENDICTRICYPRVKKVISGYKNQKGEKIEGLGGNLKYYKTDFVEAEPTDKNKRKLVKESTDMLCILENAFELVQKEKEFAIFKNTDKYLGIIFYDEAIEDYKKAIKKIDGHFNTYVFSMTDKLHEDKFDDVMGKVKLMAIPEVILQVYREIFK